MLSIYPKKTKVLMTPKAPKCAKPLKTLQAFSQLPTMTKLQNQDINVKLQ
jgi:hypothetical protein